MGISGGTARIIGVSGHIVSVELEQGALVKNEVAYIQVDQAHLQAEVLRVRGRQADLQVFEETDGIKVGDVVEHTGRLLSVDLGPGLLGQVFDGLQNPLSVLAGEYGFFLPRGQHHPALDQGQKWAFNPTVRAGDRVAAGDNLGTVQEGRFSHKIMVPFALPAEAEVTWIQAGSFTVKDPVVRLRLPRGQEQTLCLQQSWPVRRPLPQQLWQKRRCLRRVPHRPLATGIRLIDTFFPIGRGGTACIPGPFGAGKTVLQGLLARYAAVDIVIFVACGERAGEVVETIRDFSQMQDPASGGLLMDRTIIVCNTSSMPVAAREASIYTGITLGEYYRQMGYQVLLLADSTSRWAQALRETSGNLEEIPGEEAYPAYLDSAIKELYERAGEQQNPDGSSGSLTLVGTVSPAGGNFEEPVTQSTLATVKTFLGLSYDRAYKRFYPAVDPLISWSRYLQQLQPYYEQEVARDWTVQVQQLQSLLQQGDEIRRMMQVTGEEGISLADFVTYQQAQFVDMVFLQQDAFDPMDVASSAQRQYASFQLLRWLVGNSYSFTTRKQARDFFLRLTSLYKNLNYTAFNSQDYQRYYKQIEELAQNWLQAS